MKRNSVLLTALCVMALACAQFVAAQKPVDVTGNWDVTVKKASGNVMEKWTVKQSGDKITGTVKDSAGDRPVTGEMVDKVFFRVSVKTADGEELIRATADKDSMDGSITIGRAEFLWNAKRAK